MVLELLKLRTGLPLCNPEFVACIGVLGESVVSVHWSHFGPVKRFPRRDHAAS